MKSNLEILDKAEIDIDKIKNLNYFDYRYGEVSKDGRFILKNNYDNIPSLIVHLDQADQKNNEALENIYKLDQKTSKRKDDVDKVIESEKLESQKVASRIDDKYASKLHDEINNLNTKYNNEIENESITIDKNYNKKKENISKLYEQKIDNLVDSAFEKIIKEDKSDR